jgi:hypothetical protein
MCNWTDYESEYNLKKMAAKVDSQIDQQPNNERAAKETSNIFVIYIICPIKWYYAIDLFVWQILIIL